jgi:hypothetical protein
MADALASGASEGFLVGVQVPPRPRSVVTASTIVVVVVVVVVSGAVVVVSDVELFRRAAHVHKGDSELGPYWDFAVTAPRSSVTFVCCRSAETGVVAEVAVIARRPQVGVRPSRDSRSSSSS